MTSSLAFLNDVSCFQLTKIMQILSVVSTRLAGGIVLLLLLGVSVAAADELALRWKSASGDVVAERSLALDDLDAKLDGFDPNADFRRALKRLEHLRPEVAA